MEKWYVITMPLEMETLWELIANSVVMQAKSLNISHAVSNFYGTEIQIWAGFGPVGNTEKKIVADYEQLLRVYFSCFRGQKRFESCKK